ncbi:MAG: FAD-dependent oxidoreductase [Sedimentibacter sp.]|uniref:flavin monoamine oxidase family protein n=1 Tax=Sedimentibacter sp. TaxID=1960295 RepID=UPI0031583C1B
MSVQDAFYNPTDEQRHQLLRDSLIRFERPEDYHNILELLRPPLDIYQYAGPNSLKGSSIGIIGAGLAGLAAAYELRKLGAEITVFDAEQNRIGGRIYTSYFDNSGEFFAELGAMRIPVSHETTWHYINLFNLNTESLSSPNSNNFIFVNNVRLRRDFSGQNITDNIYPYYNLTQWERQTPWNELSSFASDAMLNSLTPELRTEILKIQPYYSEEYKNITMMSNRQVFEYLGLSQSAINLISAVEPFTAALINVSHDETMNGSYSLDFLNTYRIKGGMVNLPLAFFNSLSSIRPPEFEYDPNILGTAAIKFGYAVNGISKEASDGKIKIRYMDSNNVENADIFDFVICAVPFSVLREFQLTPYFSEEKMQAIRELNYIDAHKTAFLCKKRFWEENAPYGNMNGGISFTDLPIESIVYPPDHIRCLREGKCTSDSPGVLVASYNLGQDATRLGGMNIYRRLQTVMRNVELVHDLPDGYLNSLADSYATVHWNSEQWSRGAFAAAYPGQKVNFLYNMLLPEYSGRVFFAGEHVSTKPGWMQGALYSGKFVANQIALQSRFV